MITPKDRLMKHVKFMPTGCWEWQGHKNKNGYGTIHYASKNQLAHRVSFIVFNLKIPKGALVLHKCDNKPCINPKHLYHGDKKDNMRDALERGQYKPTIGENHPRAKLKDKQVLEIKRIWKGGIIQAEAIAKKYGICRGHVYKIICGYRKTLGKE